MSVVDITIVMFGCAVLLVLATRPLAIPYPSMLVLGGLAVALFPGAPRLAIDPSTALSIFLPAVLFQEASHISWRNVRRHAFSLGVVAPVLILGALAAVAAVTMKLFPGIPLAVAIVIGAVVAPADATASKAILSRLKVPDRTLVTLAGEGLVNDAIAVVIYKLAVAAALGAFVSFGAASGAFALQVAGGIGFGAAAGWLGARLLAVAAEPLIFCLTNLALAFLVYAGAEAAGTSGALATVAAGMVCSSTARRASAELRVHAAIMWQIVTFALNMLGFLLVGAQLPSVMADLGYYSPWQLAGYAGAVCATILAARLLIVVGGEALGRRLRRNRADPRHSWREDVVVGWSGMRGLVTLAAALALPMTPEGSVFPYRDLTLFLAFAAILFTLVGQGLTLAPIVRAFGQGRGHHGGDGRAARVRAAEAALEALARMEQSGAADAALIQPVRAEYQARLAGLAQADGHAEPAPPGADLAGVRKAAINAERRALLTLAKDHALDEHLLNELLDALDLAEVAASRGGAG